MKAVRYAGAAVCLALAAYFMAPLVMGILHIGMVYPAALLALAQGLIRALGQPIVHPADTRVRYHSDVLHGLASAVAQRSVGEKPSPLPLLSTGASVMRRAPLAA